MPACNTCRLHTVLLWQVDSEDTVFYSMTPPLGGMAFELKVECRPVGDGFCSIGLFVTPRDLPAGARRDFKYEATAAVTMEPQIRGITPTPVLRKAGWGFKNFFGTGYMEGGWDDAKWSSKGLPATGSLVLKLKVTKV